MADFYKDNPGIRADRETEDVAEVAIEGNEDAVFLNAEVDNFLIAEPGKIPLEDSIYLVICSPDGFYRSNEKAFIGKEFHLDGFLNKDVFVFDNPYGIMNSSLNIFAGKLGIAVGEDSLNGIAALDKLKDHINRNSGSFDAGFAETDFGVDRNSIFQGIVSHYSHLQPKLYHNLAAVSNWFKPAAAYAQTAILSENPLISSLRVTASETKQDRSNLKIDCFVGLRPPRNDPSDSITVIPRSDDILYDKITGIEYVGELAVYDIEVQGTHNFVAEGILAHNTIQGSGPKAQGTEAQKTEKSSQIGKPASKDGGSVGEPLLKDILTAVEGVTPAPIQQ